MAYHSPKKIALFWLFVIAIFIAIWLLWLGFDTYELSKNPLSHIESAKAVTMAL